MSDSRHRSGVWVQKNKNHKHGQHRSKGEIRTDQKGRIVGIQALKKGKKQPLGKTDRRNQKLQKRTLQQFQNLREKQKIESVPLDVLLIPLSSQVSPVRFVDLLKSQQESQDGDGTSVSSGVTFLKFARHKVSMHLRTADLRDLWGTLDLAKVADVVLFLHDPFEELTEEAGDIVSSLLGQGLPAAMHCVYIELERDKNAQVFLKERSEVKKQVAKRVSIWFPEPQLEFVCGPPDLSTFLFRLSNMRPLASEYREMRPYLCALTTSFTPYAENADMGTLEMTGYLKGSQLDVNGGVHLVGFGNFLLETVELRSTEKHHNSKGTANAQGVLKISADPARQEILNDSESMEDEAPVTEPGLDLKAVISQRKKVMKIVPKGTSQYQAAWIVDAEEKEVPEEEEPDEDEDAEMEAKGEGLENELDENKTLKEDSDTEYEEVNEREDRNSVGYDAHMNEDEEMEAYNKAKEANTEAMFPDEVDTPKDVPARVRFLKYRGLDDFRSNNWDMEENLPKEYGQISKFSSVAASKKAALHKDGKLIVQPYNLVCLKIRDVPKEVTAVSTPLILYGLLAHEHQMTVLNFSVRRCDDGSDHIRCNEELIFQVGFRRFKAKALLSELSAGKLHKYLRFMPAEGHFVVSVYGPITFPPAPVLVYKEVGDGSLSLLGTGTLLSLDPDRVVLKRAVLSGHPFKINVRSAVIRFMFFNTDDVEWFKKVKLTTKHGRVGEIKEPLGTHGHMKCRFDGQLQSSDTVLLKLYKRAFPKWSYSPVPLRPVSASEAMDAE